MPDPNDQTVVYGFMREAADELSLYFPMEIVLMIKGWFEASKVHLFDVLRIRVLHWTMNLSDILYS